MEHQPPPDKAIRSSVQWTPEQYQWLQARMRRLGLRSVAGVVSMLVQEQMNAEYRATTPDVDTEQ